MINEIVLEVTQKLNIPLYLVGGAVRDHLRGQPMKDYDFATPLSPDEVEAAVIAAGFKPYTIGKKFGTIGLKFPIENKIEYLEITTFRSEKYEPGSRKPEVEFVTEIHTDLSRRDFTINAMAVGSTGKIIDPFDGQSDLDRGIIRAVGSPRTRFKEDPLRILRAVRFATVLNFEIEENTAKKAEETKWSLLEISKERWVMELDKILVSPNSSIGLELLMSLDLMKIMIPELAIQYHFDQDSPYHAFDLWTHTKKVVEGIPADNLDLRWVALLHDVGKPFTKVKNHKGYSNFVGHELVGAELAQKICKYLKFSNQRTHYIVQEIKNHMKPDSILKPADSAAKGTYVNQPKNGF